MSKPYKEKIIALNGNRALINRVKKAGIETFNPKGEWNGYGYTRLPLVARIKSVGEMRKFNKILRELEEEPKKERKPVDKKAAWCRRLAKLTGISIEEAQEIAEAKLEDKTWRINDLIDRQMEGRSKQRAKLIRTIERSNPLRYIKDACHAENILAAHRRHSQTEYDDMLEIYHEYEQDGEVEKGHAKEFALAVIHGANPLEEIEKYRFRW